VIFIALIATMSQSHAATKAYFAGFAFATDHENIGTSFPISSSLLKEIEPNGVPKLERELSQRISAATPTNIDLIIGEFGNYKSGEAVSIAFALDWENISTERVGNITKIVVDVHAQILVFDFSTMKVLGSFPVAVQVRDAIDGEATAERRRSLIESIYFVSGPTNIFERFAERIGQIEIKPNFGNHLGVSDIVIEDKAKAILAESNVDIAAFESFIARSFGKFLSTNQGVAMLPYSQGHAIRNKMSARFANGDVYHLTVPEADYAIHLSVRGFKKVKLDANAVEAAWAYGSYIRVRVDQPELGKVYMDTPLKFAAVKRIPATVTGVDDFSAYQESMLSLFDQFTRQISAPDGDWVGKWTEGEAVLPQFTELARVIQRCR
jgi:hypothetical protein